MLTDEEKWLFDLHGYLVLKQAVSPKDVRHMVQLCDQWHAVDDSELPAPLASYRDRISGDLFELKQMASFRHRKKVVERLLQEIQNRS